MLRTMLLGPENEKKKKEEEKEEQGSALFLRSHLSQLDRGGETCKYKDTVSKVPELPTFTESHLLHSEMVREQFFKNPSFMNSRIGYKENCVSLDSYSVNEAFSVSSPSNFEFQKGERALHRVPFSPFSKPAPSKWDDAQKWIASPNSNRPKLETRKPDSVGHCLVQPATKILVEVPDQNLTAFGEPDTKRIDLAQAKEFAPWENEPPLIADSYETPVLIINNSFGRDTSISLSQHDSSVCIDSAIAFVQPPSTAWSVSMRDMGTEMTPIASQEPSRSGTPVRATTPIRSRSSSPCRTTDNPVSQKEMTQNTRREIMVLGKQLGKPNITAWASKEETSNVSTSARTDESEKNIIQARAVAWEEAEKAKYIARFKQDEMKIELWENRQKCKTEAEMKKVEVEVERMRRAGHERMVEKLASLRQKAEEKRKAAESMRNYLASKTEQQARYIRHTGLIPRSSSSFSFFSWCS